MKWLLALLLLIPWSADSATFGTTSAIGAPGKSMATSAPSGFDRRTAFICVVPDIQNLTNTTQDHVGANPFTTCDCGSGAVTGCITSPWCADNWRATNATTLRNLAYELTGQLDKIAWTFQGSAPPRRAGSIPAHANGVPRACDLIVQVGDIGDSGHPYTGSTAFASLPEVVTSEWNVAWHDFFSIIKQSGVPFIAAQGNHDAMMAYKHHFSEVEIQSLPGYYSSNATYSTANANPAWAVLAQTPAGPICAVTYGCNADATLTEWLSDQVGCGVSAPTIVVSHYVGWASSAPYGASDDVCFAGPGPDQNSIMHIPNDGTSMGTTQGGTAATITLDAADTTPERVVEGADVIVRIDGGAEKTCAVTEYVFATKVATVSVSANCNIDVVPTDADDTYRYRVRTPYFAMSEQSELVFANAFGHLVDGVVAYCHPCANEKLSDVHYGLTTDRTTFWNRTNPVLQIWSNWQEADRVGSTAGGVYGSGASDGLAAFYSIITIEPERDTISVRPWSPYLQSTNVTDELGAGIGMNWHQPASFTFDWCATYLGGAC